MLERLARLLSRSSIPPVPVAAVYTPSPAAEDLKQRGNSHLANGELDAAANCYRQAIAIDPDYAEAFNNLGFVALEQERFDEAEENFACALAISPHLANAHFNFARLCQKLDRELDAIKAYRAAIACRVDMIEAYVQLAYTLCRRGERDIAWPLLEKGISLNSESADLRIALGDILVNEKRFDEAEKYFKEAISLQPDCECEMRSRLADVFHRQGRLDEAIEHLQHSLAIESSVSVHIRLGHTFFEKGHLHDAIRSYEQAQALAPDNAEIFNAVGVTLQAQGRCDEALANFRRAIEINPAHGAFVSNRSLANLASGHLIDGWKDYDVRFMDAPATKRVFPHETWNGERLDDKALLIWGERGIGDEILFASLFRDIIAHAGQCIIECAPKLVPLFSRSFPATHVVPRSDPPHPATIDSIHFQCAAGSLPRWLRPSLRSFPQHGGYLMPDPGRVAHWRERLAEFGPGLKVGFGWRSHNQAGLRKLHYTSLEQWGPVFAISGMHFFNLQYDECADELDAARRRFGVPLHVFEEVDLFDDLAESAALTKALDLVISAPTTTSFLSAALGVPTWMMSYGLPWQTLGTDHLPWFPAMRCFPRRWDQPWEDIIGAIARALELRSKAADA